MTNVAPDAIPDRIEDVEHLEDLLSRPTPEAVAAMARLEGDLLILGAGGKIGPSLARMARRASDAAEKPRRILAVARYTDPELPHRLASWGIETIRCDLLDRASLDALPESPNVLFLAAMKFGSTGQEDVTWAMNVYLPGLVAERFRRSRIVAYSSGNVYPMVPPSSGGSQETDPPAPVGDYAMSVLGRERMFTYASRRWGTPTALVRLNYAHEMRYGVLVDLAHQVRAGQAIDLRMGYFNAIWQGDSNAMTLVAFDHAASPPWVVNVAGPETLSVRQVAGQFGRLMQREVTFSGTEAPDAFLSNAQKAFQCLGRPRVDAERMIRWIADWQVRGGPVHGKPTHFQTRNGKF